jgi:hypothetical protein
MVVITTSSIIFLVTHGHNCVLPVKHWPNVELWEMWFTTKWFSFFSCEHVFKVLNIDSLHIFNIVIALPWMGPVHVGKKIRPYVSGFPLGCWDHTTFNVSVIRASWRDPVSVFDEGVDAFEIWMSLLCGGTLIMSNSLNKKFHDFTTTSLKHLKLLTIVLTISLVLACHTVQCLHLQP